VIGFYYARNVGRDGQKHAEHLAKWARQADAYAAAVTTSERIGN
jgi:hypothetical protein